MLLKKKVMAKIDTDAMAQKTLETIAVLAKLPVVRVDREEFLKKQFKDSEYLDQILENGPQSVRASKLQG
mgnify:CR=1 FL=1